MGRSTLAWQYCCSGLEEDMVLLDLATAELPSNLKSHVREHFLFAVVIHQENDNYFSNFSSPDDR